VIDRVPRKLTSAQKEALQALSRQVVAQMEYKRNVLEMAEIIAIETNGGIESSKSGGRSGQPRQE